MATTKASDQANTVVIGLNACVMTVMNDTPCVLVVPQPPAQKTETIEGLPFGPFDPQHHRTLEIGLRSLVEEQTRITLGYVEQLYTFGDRGRHARPGDVGPHVISVGYLALTRAEGKAPAPAPPARWRGWYGFFPWEDMRTGRPALLDRAIVPALGAWAGDRSAEARTRDLRSERVRLLFALDGLAWDEEKVLERYECLYEAGLVAEAKRDGRDGPVAEAASPLGEAMRFDHRRILATAMGRLRAKLKYRPVVFELMPETFTLTALQQTVEAISGTHLHKQNFRRLVESGALVEPTGEATRTAGRPAALHRFRREVIRERPAPGLRVAGPRG